MTPRVPVDVRAVRAKSLGALRLVDALTLATVAWVVVMVSLPRLHDFARRENEADAFRLVERLGLALDRVQAAERPATLRELALHEPVLRRHWRDGEFDDGGVLRRHGYCFDLARDAAGAPLLRAWPTSYGETGFAAFLRRADGRGVLGSTEAAARRSGPPAPPAEGSSSWRFVQGLD